MDPHVGLAGMRARADSYVTAMADLSDAIAQSAPHSQLHPPPLPLPPSLPSLPAHPPPIPPTPDLTHDNDTVTYIPSTRLTYAAFPYTPAIFFNGAVTARKVTLLIDCAARIVDTLSRVSARVPVLLVINGAGGDAACGLAAGDFVEQLPWPIMTLAQGRVGGAVTHMFLAGCRRFMTRHSVLRLAQPRADDATLVRITVNAFEHATHLPSSELLAHVRSGSSWSAAECVAGGFADGVLDGDGFVDAGGTRCAMLPLLKTLVARLPYPVPPVHVSDAPALAPTHAGDAPGQAPGPGPASASGPVFVRVPSSFSSVAAPSHAFCGVHASVPPPPVPPVPPMPPMPPVSHRVPTPTITATLSRACTPSRCGAGTPASTSSTPGPSRCGTPGPSRESLSVPPVAPMVLRAAEASLVVDDTPALV